MLRTITEQIIIYSTGKKKACAARLYSKIIWRCLVVDEKKYEKRWDDNKAVEAVTKEFTKDDLYKADDDIFQKIKYYQHKAKPFKLFVKIVLILLTIAFLIFQKYLYAFFSFLLWMPDSEDVIRWWKYKVMKYPQVQDEKEV